MQTPLIHVVFPIHLYAGIILFVVQIVCWVIRKCKNDFVSSGMPWYARYGRQAAACTHPPIYELCVIWFLKLLMYANNCSYFVSIIILFADYREMLNNLCVKISIEGYTCQFLYTVA